MRLKARWSGSRLVSWLPDVNGNALDREARQLGRASIGTERVTDRDAELVLGGARYNFRVTARRDVRVHPEAHPIGPAQATPQS